MGDWNNDGKVDSMDYHIYTNYIDKGSSGGRRTNSSEGKGLLIVMVIGIIAAAFNELIGAAIILGYIYYQLVLK